MKKRLIVLFLGAAVWFFMIRDAPARWKGMPAPKAPVQTAHNLPAPFLHEEYTIKPLARYAVTAVVLRGERYRFAPLADLCPLDLALGWGPMSVAYAINSRSPSTAVSTSTVGRTKRRSNPTRSPATPPTPTASRPTRKSAASSSPSVATKW
jgi:hypothetical protein